MSHLQNLSLRSADEDALAFARRLQDMMDAPRLEEEEPPNEEEEEDDDTDDTDDEEEEESDEPISAEEAKKIRAALKKANDEAKRYRLEAKKLKKETATDSEKAIITAKEEAEKAVEDKYKGLLVRAEAKAALTDAGLTSGHERFIKMLDMDAIEVEDDGDIEGLTEQIQALKKDFPEVFDAKKKVAGKADAGGKTPANKKMTSAERIAANLGR